MTPIPPEMMDVHAAYLEMREKIREAAGRDDITPKQAFLLAAIGDSAITPTHIINSRWVGAGRNYTYSKERLCALGLMVETPSTYDKRKKLLSLTTEGLEVAERVRAALTPKKARAAA